MSSAPPPHSRASSRSPGLPYTAAGDEVYDELDDSPSTMGDTIRMPHPIEVQVVRPALAMLYRLAVGPSADHYASRFLAFERAGKPLAGWNWAAFALPPVWAAYRGLWIAAIVFALLHLGGAMLFLNFGAAVDRVYGLWAFTAVLLIWALPGSLAASCADYLVYRRVRSQALAAERNSENPVDAATRAASARSVSLIGGACGTAGVCLIAAAIAVDLHGAWREHVVRQQIVTSLAAVRSLEQQVEQNWTSARLVPRQTGALSLGSNARTAIEDVHVSPENGRLRVRFGPSVAELEGKAILLAPMRNAQQQVRWLCIPVDIAANYLPAECRRR